MHNLSRQNKPYTEDEVRLFRELKSKGFFNHEIARKLHRSTHAVNGLSSRINKGKLEVPESPARPQASFEINLTDLDRCFEMLKTLIADTIEAGIREGREKEYGVLVERIKQLEDELANKKTFSSFVYKWRPAA